MKLDKIKMELAKILASFNNLSTDKGVISWASDYDLPEIGEAIQMIDAEGNAIGAEDGNYAADAVTIVVADGKVSDIIKEEMPAPEEAPAATEMAEAKPKEEKDVKVCGEEENVTEEPKVGESDPDYNKMIAALEDRIAKLEERLGNIEKAPAAEPATAEFEKQNAVEKTGNKELDNLARILNARM